MGRVLDRGREREYERFDESGMSSEGSVFSMGGYRATTAELEKRYNRLWSNTNRSPIKAGSNSSVTIVASPAGSSPLPLRQANGTLPENNRVLAHAGQPVSILKRPAHRGLVEAVQSMLGNSCNAESEASRADHGPASVKKEACAIKKGVRFGNNEIRKFGATPPSRANSYSRKSGH